MTEEAEQLWPDCNDLPHKFESEGRQDWDSKKRKKVGISLCKSKVAAAASLQLCPTLCNLIDGSPPGSSVPGILQARTLEWVAIAVRAAQKKYMACETAVKAKLQSMGSQRADKTEQLNNNIMKTRGKIREGL